MSPANASESERRNLIGLYLELSKARLSALVVLTTAAGFVMGHPAGLAFEWRRLVATIIGTAMAAAGANAFNQLAEMRRDARMRRTCRRPLPSGAIGPSHSLVFSMVMAYGGLAVLGLGANMTAAVLAILTIGIYVLIYTPLKTRSTLNTLAGAVCGAIPPMIGWAAAAGRLEPGAWILGVLLFVWQIPHFFALAWLYRADYARGGFAMLPVIDATGAITGRVVVITSLLLVPVALAATLYGIAGWVYAAGSLLLGAWLVSFGLRLHTRRTDASARRLFLASIIYLPLLLGLMMVDRQVPPGEPAGPRALAAAER